MRCPTLDELPPPPPNKQGWPWTEASTPFPDELPNGKPWPLISIVTPSFCQGAFLEETIRSVLLQGYPNLEYIVIDGGSTDESVDILQKYEKWLTNWVSEPDKGQSDAINKGFAQASGEIFSWLNSDDLYEPNTFSRVANYFATTQNCSLLYGNGWYVNKVGKKTARCYWIRSYDRQLFLTFNFILQPATFWRRSVWEQTGELDINLHWAMDWDWLLRATTYVQPHYLPKDLARWRVRPDIKTHYGGWARRAEIAEICKKYGAVNQLTYRIYQFDRLVWQVTRLLRNKLFRQFVWYLFNFIPWILKMTTWRGRQMS